MVSPSLLRGARSHGGDLGRGRSGGRTSPTGEPPSGARSTLGRTALTGGGEHRLVARTWAAAADSDLLGVPVAVDDIFTFDSAGRGERPAACPCHHPSQPLTRGMLARAQVLISGPSQIRISRAPPGPRSGASARSRAGVGAANHAGPFKHGMLPAIPAPQNYPALRSRTADGDRPPSFRLRDGAARSRVAGRAGARWACIF